MNANLSRRDRAQAAATSAAGIGSVRFTSYKVESGFSVSFLDSLTFGKALVIGLGVLSVALFLLF